LKALGLGLGLGKQICLVLLSLDALKPNDLQLHHLHL
jgi:hypothetical protein